MLLQNTKNFTCNNDRIEIPFTQSITYKYNKAIVNIYIYINYT